MKSLFSNQKAKDMLLKDTDFPVSEVFGSIQGEGNYTGVNSLFIRFQLCNLTCSWCDTKYTWTQFSDKFSIQSAEALKTEISSAKQKHIIFTGGEPALYRLDLLNDAAKMIHVESNGTIIPTRPLDLKMRDGSHIQRNAMDEAVICHYNWVISPKLSNSNQTINDEALDFWAKKHYATFKFIVNTTEDIQEISDLCARFGIKREETFLGLQGNTIESQMRRELVEAIIKAGYNLSPRLHVFLWGKERAK